MESRVFAVRASALPLAMICPGSVRTDGDAVRVNRHSEPALVGTIAHECVRRLAERGSIDWDALPALAERHELDVDELRALVALASRLWSSIGQSFPDARTEVPLRYESAELVLTGTTDVLATGACLARLADWKFGRKDHDYSAQLRGYAALALLSNPSLIEATATLLWVRDGEIENYTMQARQAPHFMYELVERLAWWDGRYETGTHCEFCPRSHECAAALAMVRRAIEPFQTAIGMPLDRMTPDATIELLARARMVARYASAAEKAIRAHVLEHGPIIGTRSLLEPREEERRTLDPLEGPPILREAGFGPEEFAEITKLSITGAESIVARRARKRKGAAAVRLLRRKLDAAHAIHRTTVTTMVTRRR